jgi:hypothetical protein
VDRAGRHARRHHRRQRPGRRDRQGHLARPAAGSCRWARCPGLAGSIFSEYLAEGCSPYTDRQWRSSTRAQIEDNLGRALRGNDDLPALDLDRARYDWMRAQAGTPNMVRINTTALRAFLLWGYRHSPSYFTAEQVEYLSPGVVMLRPALAGTPAPRRRTRTRRVGQSGDFVEDEDAHSAAQVVALGEALETVVGPWGRVEPGMSANVRSMPQHPGHVHTVPHGCGGDRDRGGHDAGRGITAR